MDYGNEPLNFFGGRSEKYPNPFYDITQQYFPNNIDHMLWWAQHICYRKGFFRSAMERVASYFITQLKIETDDEKEREIYQEAFEALNWQAQLSRGGLNLLVYSNSFISIHQGFSRFLICPKCSKVHALDKIDDFEFDKGIFKMRCHGAKCGYKGAMKVSDRAVDDVEEINIVHWSPREIKMIYEDSRNKAEYFWDIPIDYRKKVTKKGNKFFAKNTPMEIFDCLFAKKGVRMLNFNQRNFMHLKIANPEGVRTDGRSIPLVMYMFDDIYMHQVLTRFNQVLCFEDIAPFRVFSLAENAQAANILQQNGAQWAGAIDQMVTEHRRDPGAYHKFPFTMNYQQLGGNGKDLITAEQLELTKNSILSNLNVPQELFNMTLNTQAIGPALRMFENAWRMVPDNYNKFLQKTADVIGRIKKLGKAKVTLSPITFADDMERKSVLGQLLAANILAKSEILESYGINYKDQLKKKKEEEKDQKELDKEEAEKEQLEAMSETSIFGQGAQGGATTPGDAMEQAQQLAQQIFPLDGAGRREELQKIKAQDQTLWANVKALLGQMTSDASSQGVQQSKQQGQQGGGQPPQQ